MTVKKNGLSLRRIGMNQLSWDSISAMSNAAVMRGEDFAYFMWGVKDDDHSVVGTSFNTP